MGVDACELGVVEVNGTDNISTFSTGRGPGFGTPPIPSGSSPAVPSVVKSTWLGCPGLTCHDGFLVWGVVSVCAGMLVFLGWCLGSMFEDDVSVLSKVKSVVGDTMFEEHSVCSLASCCLLIDSRLGSTVTTTTPVSAAPAPVSTARGCTGFPVRDFAGFLGLGYFGPV